MFKKKDEEEPMRVEIEEETLEPETESEAPSIDELQDEIERLRVELEETRKREQDEHNSHLRALADFSNYRRRHQEEKQTAAQYACQDIILSILPVVDNFTRALDAAEKNHKFETLVEGVKLTMKQLNDVLERQGVKPIQAVGEQFDPMVHEAIMRYETDEYPENTIVEELQTGYMQHDRVLRPSRVKVATLPE